MKKILTLCLFANLLLSQDGFKDSFSKFYEEQANKAQKLYEEAKEKSKKLYEENLKDDVEHLKDKAQEVYEKHLKDEIKKLAE